VKKKATSVDQMEHSDSLCRPFSHEDEYFSTIAEYLFQFQYILF
jgi:hypothetical protein